MFIRCIVFIDKPLTSLLSVVYTGNMSTDLPTSIVKPLNGSFCDYDSLIFVALVMKYMKF